MGLRCLIRSTRSHTSATWNDVSRANKKANTDEARLGQQACAGAVHIRPVNIFGSISGIQYGALSLRLFSHSQHEPCPRLTLVLLPLPTFNPSSPPPWTRMRRKQKTTFSPIPLPPSYSPATRPPPFYLFCKASSSNLITAAGAMRG